MAKTTILFIIALLAGYRYVSHPFYDLEEFFFLKAPAINSDLPPEQRMEFVGYANTANSGASVTTTEKDGVVVSSISDDRPLQGQVPERDFSNYRI